MRSFDELVALPSPCRLLDVPNPFGRPVWIKRDDLIHPQLSGNKYRKLKYPLQALAASPSRNVLTMGGLWSNHVHATAHACAHLRYACRALIRGHTGMHSAMLDDCMQLGMQVQFVDRVTYRRLRDTSDAWHDVAPDNTDWFWLPEGGSDPAALRGVAELVDELPFVPDVVLVACGTGATMAGLLAGLRGRALVIGVAVIANGDYLRGEVIRLLRLAGYPDYDNYRLLTDLHHGGYAHTSPALLALCQHLRERDGLQVEPVYTGKVFFALQHLIQSGVIALNQSVLVIHSGGLQGLRGQTATV